MIAQRIAFACWFILGRAARGRCRTDDCAEPAVLERTGDQLVMRSVAR